MVTDKSTKLLVLKIDGDLKKKFKKLTVDNDEDMTAVIIPCIKRYVAEKSKVVIH